jgi:hypothetical protein
MLKKFWLIILSFLAIHANPVFAANAVVGDGTPASCTEAALDSAVATVNSGGGGTITFNCGGVVTIPLTTQKSFSGQNAVYVLDGGNQITLDGQNNTRVLYTASGQKLSFTLKNISIINGNAKDDPQGERAANQGGGLYSGYENTLIVENVTFTNNTAKAERHEYHGGGAIAIDTTSIVTIRSSTFIGNEAPNGGAINNLLSRLTIENSTFRQNVANCTDAVGSPGDGPGGGGAIYNDAGKLTIKHTLIIDNESANLGGGIFTWAHQVMEYSGKTSIVNTVIAENHAKHGGGLWKGGSYILSMKTSTVANNTAVERGAGMSGTGPGVNFKITNSTISGNAVQNTGSAGGIFSANNSSTIINSTIAYNTVPNDDQSVGGGIHGNVTLRNTIVAYNTGGWNGTWSCMGTITNGGSNLQYPTDTCGSSIPVKDPLLDAVLSPALDSLTPGGVTSTHALLSNSPAINKGENCPSTDQRGVSRPQGDQCDIGAFELEGTAPGAFNLVSPADDAAISTFVFTWSPSNGAAEYKLTIKDAAGIKIVSEKIPTGEVNCNPDCAFTASGNFQNGSAYNWKVVAKNPFGKVKSEKRDFVVQN